MKKRILAFTLIAALLICALAGCGDHSAENSPSAADPGSEAASSGGETAVPQYAYKAEYLTVGVDDSYDNMNYINAFCISGGQLFFCGECVTGMEPYVNEATGEPVLDEETGGPIEIEAYETCLFRMDLDTQETVRLEKYTPLEVPEGQLGSSYISNMLAGADGSILLMEQMYTYSYELPEDFDSTTDEVWNYYTPGETSLYLNRYDAEGQQLSSVALNLGEDAAYPQQVLMDAAGNIYINTYDSIYLLDGEGTVLAELGNESWSDIYQIGDQVVAQSYEEGGRVFRVIDPVTKDYGEKIEAPGNASRLYAGMGEYQFLYDDYGDTVYGYNQETGESEKLFSWVDCDIYSDSLEEITVLDDGRIAALSRDYSGDRPKYEVVFLRQVDASTLPQKQTLTLACMYANQNARKAVIDFNKSHEDIRIAIQDYSEYNTEEDYTAGQTKLNTEILSGKMPDILCTNSLPISQYAAKGLLLDLWPRIDGDGELSRDDLMTHFFDVLSIDGKLYQVASSFTIQTAVGNANIVGDRTGWTVDDLLTAMDSLEDGATIFGDGDTKSGILTGCLSRSFDSFIDWETGTCSFESQAFIDLLSFANSFPAEFDWENYDWDAQEGTHSRLMNGHQLLLEAYISDFGYLQMMNAMFDGSASFIGYPSSGGSGSTFSFDNGFAISASCQNPDAAWEFVRTFLTEAYQTDNHIWAFPTNRHAFDAEVKEQMTPEYYTDPETGEQVEQSKGGWGYDDLDIQIMAMTQEEYDMFMRLYESCGSVETYNEEVFDIIQQEVEPYFAGQKTAEEAARLVQNRVSLYVMEQG